MINMPPLLGGAQIFANADQYRKSQQQLSTVGDLPNLIENDVCSLISAIWTASADVATAFAGINDFPSPRGASLTHLQQDRQRQEIKPVGRLFQELPHIQPFFV